MSTIFIVIHYASRVVETALDHQNSRINHIINCSKTCNSKHCQPHSEGVQVCVQMGVTSEEGCDKQYTISPHKRIICKPLGDDVVKRF